MIELLYSFLDVGIFLTFIRILKRYNFSKSGRFFQERFPIHSFVVCLMAMFIYLARVDEKILSIFLNVNLQSNISFKYYTFLVIYNFLFMLLYCVLRYRKFNELRKKLRSSQPNKRYFFDLKSYFYEYSNIYHMYFLKEKYIPIRNFLKFLYTALEFVTVFTIFLMSIFINMGIFTYRFCPLFPFVIIGELLFFFEGYTKEEYFAYMISINFFRTIDYEEMVNDYKKYFKNHLLFEYREDNLNKKKSQISQFEQFYQYNDSIDLQIYYRYFDEEKMPNTIMKNYIAKLINNQSIYFNTSFYYDATPYIFFASVLKLMKSRNILIVLGKDSLKEGVINWYRKGLFSICKQPELWLVEELNDNKKLDEGVGILTLSNLFETNIIEKNKEFLENVAQVIIIDPSNILLTGQIMLENLVFSLGNREEICYAVFDKNCNDIIDTLSHILKVNMTEVTPIQSINHRSIVMFWKAEDSYIHTNFFNKLSHYLGIGSELSVIALKNNVRNIKWISDNNFPVIDMKWILNQYTKPLIEFLKNKIDIMDIERLEFNNDTLINNYYDDAVIIIEDEFNNGFEMARQMNSRINKNGMIHIIMNDYLLRDYMIDNSDIFINDAKAIPFIVSSYASTLRNVVLLLLIRLIKSPIFIDEIKFYLLVNHFEIENSIKDTFTKVVEDYFEIKEDVFEEIKILEGNEEKKFLKIKNRVFIDDYLKELKVAYFLAEDESQEGNYLGARLKGHIDQSYLPGQFIVLDGKYYGVMHTSKISETGQETLVIRRMGDQISKRRFYRQIRDYKINNDSWKENNAISSKRTFNNIKVIQGFCDFNVSTKMYLESDSLNDIYHATKVNINGIKPREYKNKILLKVVLSECSEKVKATIALLLNEIFKTIYANAADYICAVTKYDVESIPNGLIHLNNIEDNKVIYIIEDSVLDLGYIESIYKNFEKIFGIVYDYCLWNTEYYKDEKTNYLNFGFNNLLKGISVDKVKTYLEKNGFQNNSLTQRRVYRFQQSKSNANCCIYCGRNVSAKTEQTDDIKICDKCYLQKVKNIDEYKELLDFHSKKFSQLYNVNLIYKINIRLKRINKKEKEHIDQEKSYSKFEKGEFIIYIQNNLPKPEAIGTIVYELSLIYQRIEFKDRKITIAKWAMLQYLYWINEIYYANYLEKQFLEDEKFKNMIEEYPISKHKTYKVEKIPYYFHI